MKIRYILCAFLLWPNGRALALVSPSTTTQKILDSQIKTIQSITGSATGTDPSKWTGIASLSERIKKESARIDPDAKKIAAWERQRQQMEGQRAALCQDLINDTRKAYGIKPVKFSAPIAMPGGFDGTRATWNPRFGEMDLTRERINKDGHSIAMGQPHPYEAITWVNGDIVITIDAFRFSPAYLASVINHETIHYDQFTDPSRGPRSTQLAREREAYNMMRGITFRSVFNLSTVELGAVETSYQNAISHAVNSPNGNMVGASGTYWIDLTLNPNGKDLLIQTMRDAKELAAKQKERQEQERRDDHDARLRETIISLTRRSCDNPGSVSQQELSVLPRPYQKPGDFRWMAPLEPRDFPGREHCVNIYEYLAYSGRDAEALRKASVPQQAPAPIVAVPVAPRAPVVPIEATKIPFSRVLPDFKSYANDACRAPQQLKGSTTLFSAYDHSARTFDDALIQDLKNGMDDCSRRLFDYLIDANRRNDYDAIQPEAIQAKVNALTPAHPGGGGGYAPPRRSEPGCEYDPNLGGTVCPKSRRSLD